MRSLTGYENPTRRPAGQVWIRELGTGEFDVLDAVFDGLSVTSRFRRFHGAIPRLSPLVRERLAAVDGHRHIAVGAFAGRGPIGIARVIAQCGGRCDLAVEVVDRWHGQGVGSRLVRAVAERARAAGHTEVVADVLADNVPIRRLLASVFPMLTCVEDDPEILRFVADLGAPTPLPRPRSDTARGTAHRHLLTDLSGCSGRPRPPGPSALQRRDRALRRPIGARWKGIARSEDQGASGAVHSEAKRSSTPS